MKIRGLALLLLAGIFSCKSPEEVSITKQYNIPKKMMMSISNNKVSLIEDLDGDGIPDIIIQYNIAGETKPESSAGDPEDLFLLDNRRVKAYDSPFFFAPGYKGKPAFTDGLKRDVGY